MFFCEKSLPQELTDAEVPTSRFCRVFCCCLHFDRADLAQRDRRVFPPKPLGLAG